MAVKLTAVGKADVAGEPDAAGATKAAGANGGGGWGSVIPAPPSSSSADQTASVKALEQPERLNASATADSLAATVPISPS